MNRPRGCRADHKIPTVLGVLGLAVLGTGCGGGSVGEDVTREGLDRARQAWERAAIRDYDLEWASRGALAPGRYAVTVRDGRVIEVRSIADDGSVRRARPADPSYYAVEGLFRIIDDDLSQRLEERPFGQPKGARVLMKFAPDPRLGYPRSYRRDVVGTRQGVAIDVIRLDPVASG